MTKNAARTKRRLENLLKRRRYAQDARPDHREWAKYNSAFNVQIRLDQNNPKGWNGFELLVTTYMRWNISAGVLEALLRFLDKEFP